MKIQELLVRAGFRKNEGVVYAALVELGAASISEISRESQLHRPTIYQALDILQGAGLVRTAAKGKRILFTPAPPAVLQKILQQAESENNAVLDTITEQLPVMTGDVRELRGPEGLRAVLDDLLETLPRKGTFYRYSSRKSRGDVEKYIPPNYRAILKEKKIEQFVITNESLKKSNYKNRMECASKPVPFKEDIFEYDVNVLVYANKVAIVDFEKEHAYIVTNENFAKMQAALFRLLFYRL